MARLIPHTFEHTTLRTYGPGSRVNIEVDILAKHVEKLIALVKLPARKGGYSRCVGPIDQLVQWGFGARYSVGVYATPD